MFPLFTAVGEPGDQCSSYIFPQTLSPPDALGPSVKEASLDDDTTKVLGSEGNVLQDRSEHRPCMVED